MSASPESPVGKLRGTRESPGLRRVSFAVLDRWDFDLGRSSLAELFGQVGVMDPNHFLDAGLGEETGLT